MDVRIDFRKILLVLALISVAVTAYAYLYLPARLPEAVLVSVGLLGGAAVSYYYYQTYEMEGMKLELPLGESVILETKGANTSIQVPKMVGGFVGVGSPIPVNLYLTDRNILAEPVEAEEYLEEGNTFVFMVDVKSILRFSHEKKVLADYIRVTFEDENGDVREVLLFTGKDTLKWIENLQELIA